MTVPAEERKMARIVPNLWFDDQAGEAAAFYTALFPNSRIGRTTRYGKAGFEFHGQPEGKVMTVEFELEGLKFIGLNGGPIFKFTPAISFLAACRTEAEVDALWGPLSAGGTALMELGAYPFSGRYGWTQDRYGLSWQVMLMDGREIPRAITPTLMFVGDVAGRAEEAVRKYAALFPHGRIGEIDRYREGEEPDRAGTVRHAGFSLDGQEFAAMDSARVHGYSFTEAVSLMVVCGTQAEIDHFWDGLSQGGDPAAQRCGWLKDRYGVSWQVVPAVLDGMLRDPDPAKVERVVNAFFQMSKFDIAELQRAFEGR
jgi:predicted 3-demethylubiquinone-9 3-methyltransferase (glyoxalase superfamily)